MVRLLRLCGAAAAAAGLLLAPAATRAVAQAPRVASLNVCTDQLLLAFADPAQIVGLSPFSRDPARSFRAAEAERYPRLSGAAEDVLALKPDLVLSFRFTRRATHEMLRRNGILVFELDLATTLEEVKRQMQAVGVLVGHPDRAVAQAGRLDAAAARARAAAAGRRPYRVLPVARRGWTSGPESLIASLMETVGLVHAAKDAVGAGATLAAGGFASLEEIVALRPDFLLVNSAARIAEDQGSAFLLHPALERLYPPEKRIVLPERLTVCAGPMLADALDRLTAELERVAR